MTRIILLSILLTLVYSWEEFKYTFRVLILRILRRRMAVSGGSLHLDRTVGVLVMLAAIPIGLAYFVASQENIFAKLAFLAGGFLMISLIAAGSGILLRRLRYVEEYDGVAKIIPLGFSLAGLFSPMFNTFSDASILPRKVIAHFALWLSLPPLVGLALKNLTNHATPDELLPNSDALIIVLMGALLALIAAEFLGRYFRFYRFRKLSAYFRVLLGILLVLVLLAK